MKKTKKMEEYVKQYGPSWDLEDARILYNNFCSDFSIDLDFDIVENDNSLMCTRYSDIVWRSVIIEWDCNVYEADWYNDLINYILELNEQANEIFEHAWI